MNKTSAVEVIALKRAFSCTCSKKADRKFLQEIEKTTHILLTSDVTDSVTTILFQWTMTFLSLKFQSDTFTCEAKTLCNVNEAG